MARSARITVADVAAAAGVSVTTVSHALNGKGRVDVETRKRVLETANRLHYIPSRAARALATGGAEAVGILLPSFGLPLQEVLESDWYGRVVLAAGAAAFDRGLTLSLLPSLTTQTIRSSGVSGLLILDPFPGDERLGLIEEARLPSVLLGSSVTGPRTSSVSIGLAAATHAMVRHLEDRGARHILFLASDIPWEALSDENGPPVAASSRAKISIVRVPIAEFASRGDVSQAAYTEVLEALKIEDRPDAVIGQFEGFGRAAAQAANHLGLSIPNDLQVAQDIDGVDTQLSFPQITAIDLHPRNQATAAVELLSELLSGKTGRNIHVAGELKLRESTR